MTSTVPALVDPYGRRLRPAGRLLDMDGTLVDTEGFWWDAEVEVFASLGHALDDVLARCRRRRPHDPQRRLPDRGHRRRHHRSPS